MAEYKGRRARKRAQGGVAGDGEGEHPPHGHMLIMIGLAPEKPGKSSGKVEGKAARKHLGKRSRGGYADGGGPAFEPGGSDTRNSYWPGWSKTRITNAPVGASLNSERAPQAGRIPPPPPGRNFGTITNTPVGAKLSGDPGRIITAGPEDRSVTKTDLPPTYPASNPQAAGRSGPPLGSGMSQMANRPSAPARTPARPAQPRPMQPAARANRQVVANNEPSADDLMNYWNGPSGSGSGLSRWEEHKAADTATPPPAPDSFAQLQRSGIYKRGGRAERRQGGAVSHKTPSGAPKKKKRKAGGQVEGAAATRHLGRRARGGRTEEKDDRGPQMLDARDDAQETGQDGRDKVSKGHGTDERAVEMGDARKRGGAACRGGRMAMGGGTKSFRTPSGSVSANARRHAEAEGDSMPGGRFPIRNRQDLSNAKHDFGRANNKPAVKRWIDKQAKELGEPPLGGE